MKGDDVRPGHLGSHVALVTGSGGGIGRATVMAFAGEGATVVGVSRRDDDGSLRAEAEALGGAYLHYTGDVREAATAKTAVELAIATFGRVDTLVNNVGIGLYGDFVDATEQTYDDIMDTNMKSTFLFTKEVLPHMIECGGGLLVQIASQAGIQGFPREAIYCASKHAQVGFTKALRRELQPHGIKVGVIYPAAVRTNFAVGHGRDEASLANESLFLRAEDIAAAVLFMAMQDSGSRVIDIGMVSLGESL